MTETTCDGLPCYRTYTVWRDGVALHVRDEGPVDAPTMLLLSGLGMGIASWDPVTDRLLRAGHRVMRLDARGHGGSDAPATGYRLHDLATDAVSVLDALDVARVHVAGHSLGGTVATQLALAHPERVASLTLLGALVAGQPPPPAFLAWATQIIKLLDNGGLPALLDALPDTALYDHHLADPVLAAEVRQQVRTTLRAPAFVPENFADAQAVGSTRPTPWDRARCGELATPVMTVDGLEDPVVAGIAEPVCAHVPGAQATVLPGAGHLAFLEQPATVAGEMLRFVGHAEARLGDEAPARPTV